MSLEAIARKICDSFTYDPGHSDLDNEQPIALHITLGDWRRLHYELSSTQSPEAGAWISVKDKLPKVDETCLVAADYLFLGTYWGDGEGWSDDAGGVSIEGVTHWMPLPVGPQPQRNES